MKYLLLIILFFCFGCTTTKQQYKIKKYSGGQLINEYTTNRVNSYGDDVRLYRNNKLIIIHGDCIIEQL